MTYAYRAVWCEDGLAGGQIEALDAVALTWPRLVDTVGARQAKADGARRLDSPSCVLWVRRQRSEVVGDTHG